MICVSCLKNLDKGYLCEFCKSDMEFNTNRDREHFKYFKAEYVSYYSGAIKNAIYNFKFNKNFRCGEYLVGILFEYIVSSNMNFDYLSYVPRDRIKVKREGFDQSHFLCKLLSRKLGIPYLKLVSCRGKQYDQKRVHIKERKLNVEGRFFASKCVNVVNDKSVLIIDDVATTYSTLNEVVNTIKKSSFKTQTSVLTIAKTLI